MFKKPQRPGHRSRVPVMEGALGKEPFVQRPSSAPDLLVSWGGTGDGGLRHPQSEGCSISLLLCGAGPIPQLWVLKAGLPACPPPQFDTPEKENLPEAESPVVLRRCSLTSSMGDEEDDGFMEILDEEEMKVGGGGGSAWGGHPQPLNHGCRHPQPLNRGCRHPQPLNRGCRHPQPLNHGCRHPQPLNHGCRHPQPLNHGCSTTGSLCSPHILGYALLRVGGCRSQAAVKGAQGHPEMWGSHCCGCQPCPRGGLKPLPPSLPIASPG